MSIGLSTNIVVGLPPVQLVQLITRLTLTKIPSNSHDTAIVLKDGELILQTTAPVKDKIEYQLPT